MLETFTINRQDIPDFIEQMNSDLRAYLQSTYPSADILGVCTINRISLPFLGDIIELLIELHYYDAEVMNREGISVFNEGSLAYLALDCIEDVDLEFFFADSSSTDPNTFLPCEDIKKSIEKQIADFLFCD